MVILVASSRFWFKSAKRLIEDEQPGQMKASSIG